METTGWGKVSSFPTPNTTSTRLMKTNDSEFIKWSLSNSHMLYKYNIITNDWKEWLKFPTDFSPPFFGACAFDINQQILYIHSRKDFIEWNVKNNTYKIAKYMQSGYHGIGALVNNTFHVSLQNKHLIWNSEEKYFIKQHTFEKFGNSMFQRLIYLKSKRQLLLLGADSDKIYSFNIDSSKWDTLPQRLPKPLYIFGCVSTRNSEYMIIFGGISNRIQRSDEIYVLNMNTMLFKQCELTCPIKGAFDAINMNNVKNEELLCFGYVRYLWNLPMFNHITYPPVYLIQLIRKYVSLEVIYLLDEDGGHWNIDVDQIILNSI